MSSQTQPPPPVVLSIAGSDPSGGAGLQADLKTFASHGTYGLGAATCSTAQVPGKVTDVSPLPAAHLRLQLDLLLETYPVAAIKTGMLHSAPLVEATLAALDASDPNTPLVVDPVMVASSGDRLLDSDAVALYRDALLPRATLFTPNLDEAAALLDRGTAIGRDELEGCARQLFERYGAAVLLKGGHLDGDTATDILADDAGTEPFEAPFVPGPSPHGTGCTYSAAVAANLARGMSLSPAVAAAKRYITAAIAGCLRWSGGVVALDHFPDRREPDPDAGH